jgi:hypothetical protein
MKNNISYFFEPQDPLLQTVSSTESAESEIPFLTKTSALVFLPTAL